jgi:hypothetical protein
LLFILSLFLSVVPLLLIGRALATVASVCAFNCVVRSFQLKTFRRYGFRYLATALFSGPKQAGDAPVAAARDFFSACRRVTDRANPLASSSNFVVMFFFQFCRSHHGWRFIL